MLVQESIKSHGNKKNSSQMPIETFFLRKTVYLVAVQQKCEKKIDFRVGEGIDLPIRVIVGF